MNDKSRGFGNRFGRIMTLAGFCIGIGNMWKFPYIVGANGGGAFLLIYLVAIVVIGYPLFILEQQLGRSSQFSCVRGMHVLTGRYGKSKKWVWVGWLSLIVALLLGCYSWMIDGWVLGYFFKTISGTFAGMDSGAVAAEFAGFSGSWWCVLCALICALMAWLMLNTDVKKGIEKLCSYAMPTLLVLLVGLAIYSNTLPGSHEGLLWYLVPNFEGLDVMKAIQAAVVQVFFSVGIGMACAFVYGSYTSRDADLCGDSVLVVLFDTAAATLAGLAITPALFAYNVDPASGVGLIFISLPQVFSGMPSMVGRIFGGLFFLALFLACITSVVAIVEAGVSNFSDRFGWSRKKANTFTVSITFLFSILVTLNQGEGILAGLKVIGMDIFSFLDMIGCGFGLSIVAIGELAFVIFVMKFSDFQKEINSGAGKIKVGNWAKGYYYVILPILLLFVFYCVIRVYFG